MRVVSSRSVTFYASDKLMARLESVLGRRFAGKEVAHFLDYVFDVEAEAVARAKKRFQEAKTISKEGGKRG